MRKKYLMINTNRSCYAPEDAGRTMTVGELKDYLNNFSTNSKILFRNDGYTYGELNTNDFWEQFVDEDDE